MSPSPSKTQYQLRLEVYFDANISRIRSLYNTNRPVTEMAPPSKNHCPYALNISVVTLKRYYMAAARQLSQIETNNPDNAEIVEDFLNFKQSDDRLVRTFRYYYKNTEHLK